MDEHRLGESRLCHLPYVGDSANEPRYSEFRPSDDGSWLLHGHVHEMWRVRDKMINVGVDQWGFAPPNLPEIAALARAK